MWDLPVTEKALPTQASVDLTAITDSLLWWPERLVVSGTVTNPTSRLYELPHTVPFFIDPQ